MLAHNQGAVLNAANLARSLEVSGVTIRRYLDLRVDLLLVRRLQRWTFNVGKCLVRSAKVYIQDSGIAHALLNITGYNDLLGHPVAGGSWEGFVIENILSDAPAIVQPFYYSTPGGAEIDLVLEFSDKENGQLRSSAVLLLPYQKGSTLHVMISNRKDAMLFTQALSVLHLVMVLQLFLYMT